MDVREKLVELIGQVQDCGCDVTDAVAMNYVENITLVDHLIANGVTVQEWISVKDRLPVDWCPVLVMVREIEKPLLGSYRENVWFHERWNTTFINGAVTHWMPLPQPSKGE